MRDGGGQGGEGWEGLSHPQTGTIPKDGFLGSGPDSAATSLLSSLATEEPRGWLPLQSCSRRLGPPWGYPWAGVGSPWAFILLGGPEQTFLPTVSPPSPVPPSAETPSSLLAPPRPCAAPGAKSRHIPRLLPVGPRDCLRQVNGLRAAAVPGVFSVNREGK